MLDDDLVRAAEATVRAVATAAKTLRLYPAASPMPRQAAEAAIPALGAFLERESSLVLTIARDGFTVMGTPLSSGVGGAGDLADMLRSHGVAEVVFSQGVSIEDLLAFLGVVMRAPEEVRDGGGIVAALTHDGVMTVKVVTVSLAITAEPDDVLEMGEDVDEFFRELASDPKKLATWLAAASKGDPANLAEGIQELAGAAGAEGMQRFLDSFASAFVAQDADGRDAIMGLGLEGGGTRDLLEDIFTRVPTDDMSNSLVGGVYGKNMMSLSNALAKLPLGGQLDAVIAEVRASLPQLGHESREVGFLDHMLEVRANPDPERPLVEVDPTYRHLAEATVIEPEVVADAQQAVAHAGESVHEKGVATMLALLDQQEDFILYIKSLDALASTVPRLLASRELDLADRVLSEIAQRESRTDQPWPELTQRLRLALKNSLPREAMGSLLAAMLAEPGSAHLARSILRHADEAVQIMFVEEAVALRDDAALAAVEQILGRRTIDLLANASARAQWSQVGPVVRWLAAQPDASATRALDAIGRRPDEQSRNEAAVALGEATGPGAGRLLAGLLRDSSAKVAVSAARSLAKNQAPGSAEALSARIGELDIDGKDFQIARELIGALAHIKGATAQSALKRLAERRALIKRGHFVEIQQLAQEAVRVQSKLGAD